MFEFGNVLNVFREQVASHGSRTDALRPLSMLMLILLTALVLLLVFGKTPGWLLIFMAVLLLGVIGLFGFAYVYCLFKRPDALRSEKYLLQRMAIEHGVLGDSITGITEIAGTKSLPLLEDKRKSEAEQ